MRTGALRRTGEEIACGMRSRHLVSWRQSRFAPPACAKPISVGESLDANSRSRNQSSCRHRAMTFATCGGHEPLCSSPNHDPEPTLDPTTHNLRTPRTSNLRTTTHPTTTTLDPSVLTPPNCVTCRLPTFGDVQARCVHSRPVFAIDRTIGHRQDADSIGIFRHAYADTALAGAVFFGASGTRARDADERVLVKQLYFSEHPLYLCCPAATSRGARAERPHRRRRRARGCA